jgi:hypothetical protein
LWIRIKSKLPNPEDSKKIPHSVDYGLKPTSFGGLCQPFSTGINSSLSVFTHAVKKNSSYGKLDCTAVQEHLGHTSLTMTQRYAHLSPEFQRVEEEKLNGVFTNQIADRKKFVRHDEVAFGNENSAAGNS